MTCLTLSQSELIRRNQVVKGVFQGMTENIEPDIKWQLLYSVYYTKFFLIV